MAMKHIEIMSCSVCCKGKSLIPPEIGFPSQLYSYDIKSQQKKVMTSVFSPPPPLKRSILTIPNYVGVEKNIL